MVKERTIEEAIGKIEAKTYREALHHFANKKRLSVEEFQKLYEVTNYTDGKRFTL